MVCGDDGEGGDLVKRKKPRRVLLVQLVGFQRWCLSSSDKRIPWDVWEAAKYQPRNLHKKKRKAGRI